MTNLICKAKLNLYRLREALKDVEPVRLIKSQLGETTIRPTFSIDANWDGVMPCDVCGEPAKWTSGHWLKQGGLISYYWCDMHAVIEAEAIDIGGNDE